MSWLPPDVEYRIEVLRRELERTSNQIPVYELGIREETKDLELQWVYRQALLDAIKFLKATGEAAVSLSEYKNILVDLALIDQTIIQKQMAIFNLTKVLADKRKEIEQMKNNMLKLSMLNRRGVLLDFRKKDGYRE